MTHGAAGAPRSKKPSALRELGLGKLATGLPALLVAGLVFAIGVRAMDMPRDRIISRYKTHAERALQARDFADAKVCYERLLAEGISPAETSYGLARVMDGLGDSGQAMALLIQAASLDGPDYVPAHIQLAQALLRNTPLTSTAVAAAESHLRRALANVPGRPSASPADAREAEAILGELLAGTGRPRLALPYLRKAAVGQPEMRLALARAYQSLGLLDNTRAEATTALKEFQTQSINDPDALLPRLRAAEAAALLNDFARAADIVGQGLARTNDGRYRSSLATIYAAWADFLEKNHTPAAERVLLLERGLQIDPASAALLERFLHVLNVAGPEAEPVRARLRGLLAQGRATASVHFTLGVDAWLHGNADSARLHFEEADKLAPRSPIILNNLAWVLAHDKKPDLPHALKLVQYALERQPDTVLYRGTRGVILSKMERWRDALPDLEAALERDPKNPDLHLALAETYDRLGDRAMATQHREAARNDTQAGEPAPAGPPKER